MFGFFLFFSCFQLSNLEARKPEEPPSTSVLHEGATEKEGKRWRLYRVPGCVGCHSPPFSEAKHLGGNRDLPTIFGLFYAPNISLDLEDGIGSWTEEDFFRAIRKGASPKNKAYWPTFPYMA